MGKPFVRFSRGPQEPPFHIGREQLRGLPCRCGRRREETYEWKHSRCASRLLLLYFEAFTADEDTTDEKGQKTIGLRKTGFGKEHKPGPHRPCGN